MARRLGARSAPDCSHAGWDGVLDAEWLYEFIRIPTVRLGRAVLILVKLPVRVGFTIPGGLACGQLVNASLTTAEKILRRGKLLNLDRPIRFSPVWAVLSQGTGV